MQLCCVTHVNYTPISSIFIISFKLSFFYLLPITVSSSKTTLLKYSPLKRTKIWEKTRIIFLFVFQRTLSRNTFNSHPHASHPQLFVSRHWNLHAYRCLLTLNDAMFQLSFNEYAAKTGRKTCIVTDCAITITMHDTIHTRAHRLRVFTILLFIFYCSASLDDLSEVDSKGWRVVRPWQRAGALRKVSNFLLLTCHLSVCSHSF